MAVGRLLGPFELLKGLRFSSSLMRSQGLLELLELCLDHGILSLDSFELLAPQSRHFLVEHAFQLGVVIRFRVLGSDFTMIFPPLLPLVLRFQEGAPVLNVRAHCLRIHTCVLRDMQSGTMWQFRPRN